ncbi:MAG: 23S rRNA (adenine(2503)-C(2))-methyltransferase RlmN [Flammeovirgaceae bacterium]|nr:23S rRNA (adenine(2503)-C(2))-methyltransferase RlmN [Flammeovirgaceae bacterium]
MLAKNIKQVDIRKVDLESLSKFLVENGEKAFKAKQIIEWLWKKSATSFEEMTNLSLRTRELIAQHYVINPVCMDNTQFSNDGTIKSAFKLYDSHLVEGVLIPTTSRMTACISSQVGCSLTCKFCATGYMDRKRNLDPGEIYDQVVQIKKQSEENFNQPLTNIVYMGMGEPLLNYKNVLQSVELLTSPKGLGMSPKRITISTAGIAKMIKKLADDQVKFNLALSLHAANDSKRNQIMPINEQNSLEALRDALKYYYAATKNAVTYEYIVFNSFNDNLSDAEELYQFTKHLPCKVNIIEYNPISEADFTNTGEDKLDRFSNYLAKKGVNVRVRRSRGKDIDAACGQLANKNK